MGGTVSTWRVGRKLGRTLYRDEVCVGMVDTPELAAEIVAAMNAWPGESCEYGCPWPGAPCVHHPVLEPEASTRVDVEPE